MKNYFIIFLLLFPSITYSFEDSLITNIFFKTPEIGWVEVEGHKYEGYHIYKTTNGGLSWKLVPEMYLFGEGQFFNDSVGILNPYKTTDGGETWHLKFTDYTVRMFFVNEKIGFGAKRDNELSPYRILKTTNGGDSWNNIGELSNLLALWVFNKESIIAMREAISIIKTTNNGLTWSNPIIPFPNGGSYFFLQSISFADDSIGFLSAIEDPNNRNSQNRRILFKSTDAGNTWLIDTTGISGIIKFTDSINGYMHSGISFLKTTDKGNSWFEPGSVDSAWTFFFLDRNYGYAVGRKYYFAKTTDGGCTWTQYPFNIINPTIQEESNYQSKFLIEQNYPNPFNPSTKIKYTIPKQGFVTIKVYDVLGKEIMQLVNEEKPSGEYEVEFDGNNLSSGIYFYQIQAGEFLDTKKMVLMK